MALIKRIIQIPDDSIKVAPDEPQPTKDQIVGIEVTAEKGAHYWAVLTGKEEAENRTEEEYCNTIHRIHLNWENAPGDYIIDRYDVLRSMYKGLPKMAEVQKRYVAALDERKANG